MKKRCRWLVVSITLLVPIVAAHAQEGPAIATPQPNYDAEMPQVIRGVVYEDTNRNARHDEGEPGIEGVAISDGLTVVATDASGRFELRPSPNAVFITMTRPRGYSPSGPWYQAIAPEVEFGLTMSESAEGAFNFIHVTDNHLSDRPDSHEGLREFVAEVNALDPPPAFVFNTGDLVNCTKQLTTPVEVAERYFSAYVEIMGGLETPWYNVAGDHSDVGYRMEQFPRTDFRCGKAMYWEYLGPHFFSFEFGNLHIVSIDAVYKGGADKEYSEKSWGRESMLPEHLAWLEQDLKHRSSGTIVLTGSENPLHDFIPGFERMAEEHHIRLQLVGDTHVVSYQDTPVPSQAAGALSGTWWNGPCADLSPQGYMIYHVDGEGLTWFYKGLGRQVEIVTPLFGAAVSGTVRVESHLVTGDLKGPLEYRIGDGEWQSMERGADAFYRANYAADFDSTALPDGLAELSVRAADGAEERTIPLMIANAATDFSAAIEAILVLEPSALIGSNMRPQTAFTVFLNDAPIATVEEQRTYEISIPAENLRRVNRLRIETGQPLDAMTMNEPHLIVGEQVLSDPRQKAIRAVRLNHWSEEIVARAGVVIGPGEETSFAVRQEEFCFEMPETQGIERPERWGERDD